MRYKCNELFHGSKAIWIANAQNGQEVGPSIENMRGVPKAFRLAQEMGQGLG
jgi:hypothetical protein